MARDTRNSIPPEPDHADHADHGAAGKRARIPIAVVPLIFVAGVWAGVTWSSRSPEPTDEERIVSSRPATLEPTREADCPAIPPPSIVATDSRGEEGLEFDLMSAIADILADVWGGRPLEVVSVVTKTMSDRQLSSALTNLTDVTDADLEEIDDIHLFSERLLSVAAEGLITDVRETYGEGTERIEFFTADSESAQDVFRGGPRKIFAEYRTSEDGPSKILVKWIQEDPFRLLQLDRRTLDPSKGYFTDAKLQSGGWPEGHYRLQIFALNDAMDLVAEGRFQVVGGPTAP